MSADVLRTDRLGDFGLSKVVTKYNAVGGVPAVSREEGAAAVGVKEAVLDDTTDVITSGVLGTLFYISPEIEKVHTRVLCANGKHAK